ncbi:MAG TPA: NAD(P)H-binding protein, partial [Candidatus Limnocylindrales bacterium]|nr:NAD(P)H-binding protein [Candidatus Limnocylindrales bacterium]
MTSHQLVATQLIGRPLADVFAFFEKPGNLARLTPAGMRFEFLTEDLQMREGLEIDYRLRPLLGIPVGWRTRIDDYDPPNRFTDTQLRGPYRRWEHRHSFRAVEGGTLITDEIEYELPFGVLGDLVHRLVVRGELERIFRHRAMAVEAALRSPDAEPTGRTVAVAGGTGFVGGAIAAELHRRGDRVVVLSHRGEAARGVLPDDVEIRNADVGRPDSLAPALAGVDGLVIALAFAGSPMEQPRMGRTFEAVDAAGTERLVAAAREAGVPRVVYLSGAGAAPDARRHWFRAKWRAEEAVRASGLTWTIIRPTWIFGPRDVSLNRFLGFARRLPFVPLSNSGRQLLAPVFVDDAARLAADSLLEDAAADRV